MKIPYEVKLGTFTNQERGFYHENNDPYEEVQRPLAQLVANGIVIEEVKGYGSSEIKDYEIKSLKSTAESVLNSKSIKENREYQKKLINKVKKDFNKLLKAYDNESIAREKFALDRLNKLKNKKLKEWKTFKYIKADKIDEIIKVLEKSK